MAWIRCVSPSITTTRAFTMTGNQPKAAAAESANETAMPKANSTGDPPAVITVDTTTNNNEKEGDAANGASTGQTDGKSTPEEKSMGQARTPKHANKGREGEDGKDSSANKNKSQITPERQQQVKSVDQYGRPIGGLHARHPYGGFSPPRPYEGRPLGGGGAFQPHDSRQAPAAAGGRNDPPAYYNPAGGRPPMHVSPPQEYRPGYYGAHPDYRGPPPPGPYPPYDQRYALEGPNYRGPPPPQGQYRGPPYPPSYRGYEQGGSWGGPPYQRPPPYPGMPPEHYQQRPPPANTLHEGRYMEQQQAAGGNPFSRAVSSSFGSSGEKPGDKHASDPHYGAPNHLPAPPGGPPDDQSDGGGSWGLNQVASVDEAVMRERMEKRDAERHGKADHPASNSSSLTNSPTEGHEAEVAKQRASIPTPSKLASLDSLSSVASAQEPLTTSKEKDPTANNSVGHLSPGSSASLDLMKCSSGSSGLLHLATANMSFPPPDARLESKRTRDEEDRDVMDDKNSDRETRRADPDGKRGAAEDTRPTKKSRHDDDAKIKESPLSIHCSPGAEKAKQEAQRKSAQEAGSRPSSRHDPRFSQSPEGGYFDKAPSYTYSIDSAPPLPKDNLRRAGYPPLPHRPGSSSSSTITPMQVDGPDGHGPPGVGPSLPSWEIQQQDSFSGGSGAPLMSSFSFTQDYPVLSSSGSNLGFNNGEGGPPPPHLHPGNHNQMIESRNQSFEGGHFHGSFSRTESMDISYGSRPPYGDRHHLGYIHHAPSWGSHGPPPGTQGHYGQYHPRLAQSGSFSHGPGPMMRNYSEERVSPPPGPPGMRLGNAGGAQRGGFQPPPELMAPANPHLARRPQQTVYLMSSPPGGHQQQKTATSGSFSWSKEDDARLTEVMKKYKNPRDWEPISKEHGRGKT